MGVLVLAFHNTMDQRFLHRLGLSSKMQLNGLILCAWLFVACITILTNQKQYVGVDLKYNVGSTVCDSQGHSAPLLKNSGGRQADHQVKIPPIAAKSTVNYNAGAF